MSDISHNAFYKLCKVKLPLPKIVVQNSRKRLHHRLRKTATFGMQELLDHNRSDPLVRGELGLVLWVVEIGFELICAKKSEVK